MIKLIPMLFSHDMAVAYHDKTKTQTRRTRGLDDVNKLCHEAEFLFMQTTEPNSKKGSRFGARFKLSKHETFVSSPYGKPGDILWCREAFCDVKIDGKDAFALISEVRSFCHHSGLQGLEFDFHLTQEPAPTGIYRSVRAVPYKRSQIKWKPNMHMPMAYCRDFREIIDVRIERLGDITDKSAIAEGIKVEQALDGPKYKNYLQPDNPFISPVNSFVSLWESINGPGSWSQNMFVWVVEFSKESISNKEAMRRAGRAEKGAKP